MMQHEILEKKRLLDENGTLTEPGYAKKLILTYDRNDIKAHPLRIKEWDYYLINNDKFALALTIADNSYMGLDSVSFMDFDKKWDHTKSYISFMTEGKRNMPSTSQFGNCSSKGKTYTIDFKNDGKKRVLTGKFNDFMKNVTLEAYILLTGHPDESMVIATPFKKDKHAFYYNQKINCLKAEGHVRINDTEYTFDIKDSVAVLDWGRGVWTYKNTWYWGSASGYVEGVPFGFNIGYGFGDTKKATENMIFYDGKAHKINKIEFVIPSKNGKEYFLSPWKFITNDKRLDMDFIPVLDRAACTSAVIIKSDQHQVFGRFSGTAVLDDKKQIVFKDLTGFAEKVYNKW